MIVDLGESSLLKTGTYIIARVFTGQSLFLSELGCLFAIQSLGLFNLLLHLLLACVHLQRHVRLFTYFFDGPMSVQLCLILPASCHPNERDARVSDDKGNRQFDFSQLLASRSIIEDWREVCQFG